MVVAMKTYIFLDNGQSVQTTDNTPSDIAGLINAGVAKIYTCVDALNPATTHQVVVSHIVDIYEQ
jgi:hypothetical protein